ncbi:Panacea domain-containing protein [Cryobacterium zhongshanensis]|uniref:DUF4065 domain-containing protein n=1 Tax=Cryobacterium zhongshanensis TaxID=2928153 RepID=A0AA41R002_9MICO|nr:type II toxin-antitoxin system antitoxin SocA domain-containing protein [Cryobacterium zhongshanensis]MCI4659548.1 DUF4065 domain-containing protein [Cryobacterium zhongshanensis]
MTEHAHHQLVDAGVAAEIPTASHGETAAPGETGTVSIFDVAEYILAEKGEMSTMKLQKLLYFAQAWAITWTGEPLFAEDFEAWASGPVCRELYEMHQGEYSVGPGYFTAKLLAAKEALDLAESSVQ